ncbi:MAG: hypothetical protein ACOCXI_07385 [Chloroflexota bacterium]
MRNVVTALGRSTRLLQRLWRLWLPLLGLIAALLLHPILGALPVHAGAPRQDAEQELLENAGFEDGFYLWNGNNGLQVGTGWMPWWIDNPEHEPSYTRPEYREISAATEPNRVHSGESAQQWSKLHSSYYAGVYQQVAEVTPQQAYRFTLWAQVWSSDQDDPADVSNNPANPHLQIGIDPHGDVDPFSADIIWSYESGMQDVIDDWSQLGVEAIARDSTVTVFVRSRPEFANRHNYIFIDSASLQAIAAATPTPTATATPTVEPPTLTPTVNVTVEVATTSTATPTIVVTETVSEEPPTATPATTITNTVAATQTGPAPTGTAYVAGEGEGTQPPEPTTPVPVETATATALPAETPATPVAANTVIAPAATATPATGVETAAAPTTTLSAESTVTATAEASVTAVAMVNPTGEDEATAQPQAPPSSGEESAARGLLCAAPILMIGLFGLALVLMRRRLANV